PSCMLKPTYLLRLNASAPTLDVRMSTVLRKSTVLPLESVKRPSSSTCSKILNTSGCAFSISSSNITEYGLRLTFSVNWPPSSYPTYPGGEPTSLEVECFSMYSDMSILINASSSPNIDSANARASSVFPTPVGPRKINDPIGRFGSFSPALALRTAFATDFTASSCPITLECKISSSFNNLSVSVDASFETGTPVQLDTTLAMSSVVTSVFSCPCFSFQV